jgi:RNA polymerase sigma-70 factor, ECF subfamily
VAWPAAYRIARSVLSSDAAAEDAAQEACAHAVAALGTLRDPASFAPWFYRIVVNEARQGHRRMVRELPLEASLGNRIPSRPDEFSSRDDRIDVRRAIDALEPALRATIVLRYYFGMSSAEIGRILSTSPVTARWRLMVAHRKLRVLLDPAPRPDFAIVEEPCR